VVMPSAWRFLGSRAVSSHLSQRNGTNHSQHSLISRSGQNIPRGGLTHHGLSVQEQAEGSASEKRFQPRSSTTPLRPQRLGSFSMNAIHDEPLESNKSVESSTFMMVSGPVQTTVHLFPGILFHGYHSRGSQHWRTIRLESSTFMVVSGPVRTTVHFLGFRHLIASTRSQD